MAKISQKSNDYWTFRCYGSHGGERGIHAWYGGLRPEVQAAFDAAMETLAASRRSTWPGLYEELRGSGEGLTKIEIAVPKLGADPDSEDDDDMEQHRILCFEGPNRNEITLLYGFEKNIDSDYGPAIRSALKRKDGVLRDGNRAQPCNFP